MVLVLYGTEGSSPVRAVLLTLRALELEHEFREIDLTAGDQLKPDYVSKNPQHTVPTLQDGDAYICDSHAIMGYLVQKYAKDDALYPREPLQRAIVDQRLHFETGVLSIRYKQLKRLLFQEKVTELPVESLHETYALLELFLDGHEYMAGEQLTIADFSIVTSVSTAHLSFAPVDATKYPNLSAWLARISMLPYYEQANLNGARRMAELVRAKLPKQFDKLWQKAFEDIKSGAGKM
ncbi:glutathione S-transferase 1-like [Drosophila innubila]|uniref:glutathione S-transferase 1-like n=1 Tax=Drosophila innubila TaxID=198719 RepID=UPI00148B59CB|nr:glutathione S-transferase 1-like [Drosophila innubila]